MRKGIKIKVSLILLAWLVLFLHSIIPHNHSQESLSECHELLHKHTPVYKDCNSATNLISEPEESTVCHFSGLLFNQDMHNDLLFLIKQDNYCYYVQLTKRAFVSPTLDLVSNSHRGTPSLRAPPVG